MPGPFASASPASCQYIWHVVHEPGAPLPGPFASVLPASCPRLASVLPASCQHRCMGLVLPCLGPHERPSRSVQCTPTCLWPACRFTFSSPLCPAHMRAVNKNSAFADRCCVFGAVGGSGVVVSCLFLLLLFALLSSEYCHDQGGGGKGSGVGKGIVRQPQFPADTGAFQQTRVPFMPGVCPPVPVQYCFTNV